MPIGSFAAPVCMAATTWLISDRGTRSVDGSVWLLPVPLSSTRAATRATCRSCCASVVSGTCRSLSSVSIAVSSRSLVGSEPRSISRRAAISDNSVDISKIYRAPRGLDHQHGRCSTSLEVGQPGWDTSPPTRFCRFQKSSALAPAEFRGGADEYGHGDVTSPLHGIAFRSIVLCTNRHFSEVACTNSSDYCVEGPVAPAAGTHR